MTADEVLKMLDAGFTVDEIRAMNNPEDKPKDPPEDKPKDPPEDKPKDPPEDKPDEVAALKTKIGEMEKTIKDLQDANLKKNYQPAPDDPVNKNIDDFLKSL